MNFFHAFKYLKYMLMSGHRKGHGIHSPFIFDLVSRIFRNKRDDSIVLRIETVRKKLLSDSKSILVNDLGSGLEKSKTNIRKVSDIARNSPVPKKFGLLLSNLAAEFGNPLIVEFGTSFGISTMYMASGCPGAAVFTMEGCPEISGIAVQNFKSCGFDTIKVLTGSFDNMIPLITQTGIKPGLVFIDGNHKKEPVLRYFSIMADVSDKNTVIVIDDIYSSREMGEAWKEIRKDERVSVTVDVFRMGVVFFREGINHNDYIIRY